MMRSRWLGAWVAVVSAVLVLGYVSDDASGDGSRVAQMAASANGATESITRPQVPASSITVVETGRVQISARAETRLLSLVWFAALAAAVLQGAFFGRPVRRLGAALEQATRSQSERSSPASGRRAPPLLAA